MTQTSTPQPTIIDLTGLPANAVEAIRTLVETLRRQTTPPTGLAGFSSPDEWIKAIREWAAAHPPQQTSADWNRESIYEGCGE